MIAIFRGSGISITIAFIIVYPLFKGSLGTESWRGMAALSPLGKMAGVEEMSNVYLYVVIGLLASRAGLFDLLAAPMWLLAGIGVLMGILGAAVGNVFGLLMANIMKLFM